MKVRSGTHPSTRYRILVDLVRIVVGASVAADVQREALVSEFQRRGLQLPTGHLMLRTI